MLAYRHKRLDSTATIILPSLLQDSSDPPNICPASVSLKTDFLVAVVLPSGWLQRGTGGVAAVRLCNPYECDQAYRIDSISRCAAGDCCHAACHHP